MTYNDDMQWDELAQLAKARGTQLVQALILAKEAKDDWDSFRDARSDATLATYFDTGGGGRSGTVAADVADLKQCFVAMEEVYEFVNNVAAPTQGDRLEDWRKFS